jgi:hypothetical protein
MTEQEIRDLGLDQITAGVALGAIAAQFIRREALEALLAEAGDDAVAREAVIRACKQHPDARWWLLHQRSWGVPAAEHWASVLGEEVNRATAWRQPPVA